MDLPEIDSYLHDRIPLTAAMGVQVASWDGTRLVMTAPLEPNHNHLGTAFGGSLVTVATLAGYSLLWLMLQDREAHVVVRRSTADYRQPVTGEIRAICMKPDAGTCADFMAAFARNGKARLHLRVTVEEAGTICMDFTGEYVALR